MSRNILLIGAFSPEINLLVRTFLVRGSKDFPAVTRVYGEAVRLEAFECGIGNITAALNFQEKIIKSETPPDECIFIGSAGVYPAAVVGDLLPARFGFSRDFANYEIAVLEGRGRIPDLMESRVRTDPGPIGREIADALALPEGYANSPDSLTLAAPAPEGQQIYRALDFENMEVFGLAAVARRYEIPFCALLALTNRVGPDGSKEWAANHRTLGQQLQMDIIRVLEN